MKIKPSKIEASELQILTGIYNDIGLLLREAEMPEKFRAILRSQFSLLNKIRRNHGLIYVHTGISNGALEEWPDAHSEIWEAIK